MLRRLPRRAVTSGLPEEGALIVEPGRGQQGVVARVLAALLAVALGLLGAASFAFGSCHDSGGFCAPSFGVTHVLYYSIGVVLMSAAAGVLALAFTRRRRVAAGIAGSAAVLLLVLIVVVETTE